jgi:M6 family metalloprotease-like protein
MRKFILIMLAILPLMLSAAYLQNLPTQVTQPDGTVLNLLASGDEFANRLHDANGYTIIQSATDGYYYYAQKNGDELVPSVWRADSNNPAMRSLVPNLNISAAAYQERARVYHQRENRNLRTPQTGVINNISILIRFSDQTEFDIPRSAYEYKFNAMGDTVNSLRNYYDKVSYNQLDIVTHIYPIVTNEINLSYVDIYPRNYYLPFNAFTNQAGYTDEDQRTEREQTLVASAIEAIAPQIPADLNIDGDDDGYVDNVCFIIRGPHSAWAELLWAHRWGLFYTEATINNKQVYVYTFQPENQNDVNVLSHEMFHSLGSPDLYHYDFNGVSPVGCWDLMESGNGHMGAYMKWRYGTWLPAPTIITQTGDYTLQPLTSETGNYYRINVTGNNQEYFILEYRKKGSDFFERNIPESGLLIYRIKPLLNGNSEGPPDEVYIFRPDGTVSLNGQITEATFSQNYYRTEFNDFTNPNSILTYGALAHLNISNIGLIGDTMTFHYTDNTTNLPPLVNITSPWDEVTLVTGEIHFNAAATATNSTITNVDFTLDGTLLGSQSTAPFTMNWTAGTEQLGNHELIVTATAANGLSTARRSRFKVIDPMQQNWFGWVSDSPVYAIYGRGAIPIQVAIDLDLGLEEYVVKKLAFYVEADPYGFPAVPGLVEAKINTFSNGIITDETLLQLGSFIDPMTGRFEVDINDTTILHNQIAVVLNLFEYQNIKFDSNGIAGHTWLAEPDRPWTDALGRGMLGGAVIELKLQNPYNANDDAMASTPQFRLSNYPNPFTDGTTLSYALPKDGNVSIAIYNLKGQKVKTMLNGKQAKGSHELTWKGLDDNGNAVSSGIYLVRMSVSGKTQLTKKIILSK